MQVKNLIFTALVLSGFSTMELQAQEGKTHEEAGKEHATQAGKDVLNGNVGDAAEELGKAAGAIHEQISGQSDGPGPKDGGEDNSGADDSSGSDTDNDADSQDDSDDGGGNPQATQVSPSKPAEMVTPKTDEEVESNETPTKEIALPKNDPEVNSNETPFPKQGG